MEAMIYTGTGTGNGTIKAGRGQEKSRVADPWRGEIRSDDPA
jgi:hypothetical protein